MPWTVDEVLLREFRRGFQNVWDILKRQRRIVSRLSVEERKILAETAIFLREMKQSIGLCEEEEQFAESWLRQIGHILGREFETSFVLELYYFSQNYKRDPVKTVNRMISLMVSLRALECCGIKLSQWGTVWKYLERDIPYFRRRLKEILVKNDLSNKVNELFLLFNTIDTLSYIQGSEILHKELGEFIKVAEQLRSIKKAFDVSPGLKIYATDLTDRLHLSIDIGELPTTMSPKTRAFLNLMKLRKGVLPSSNEMDSANHPLSLHLWWIAKAWARRLQGEEIVGIIPFCCPIDNIDDIFNVVWGDLSQISITDEEKKMVLRFNSQKIKQQLYQYFSGHPFVTEYSKTQLSNERDKADAGGEISDFNVEFNIGNEKIWIAIPIKSGAEVGNQARGKIEQRFLHQFIRPIVMFGSKKVAVFPIIIVKPTLNTTEFLSLLRAHLQLPIRVIDIETYTKFLKREKML